MNLTVHLFLITWLTNGCNTDEQKWLNLILGLKILIEILDFLASEMDKDNSKQQSHLHASKHPFKNILYLF